MHGQPAVGFTQVIGWVGNGPLSWSLVQFMMLVTSSGESQKQTAWRDLVLLWLMYPVPKSLLVC